MAWYLWVPLAFVVIAALPFYVYILNKCASAGRLAGALLFKRSQQGESKNGKG